MQSSVFRTELAKKPSVVDGRIRRSAGRIAASDIGPTDSTSRRIAAMSSPALSATAKKNVETIAKVEQ